jgi:hypothetical protein
MITHDAIEHPLRRVARSQVAVPADPSRAVAIAIRAIHELTDDSGSSRDLRSRHHPSRPVRDGVSYDARLASNLRKARRCRSEARGQSERAQRVSHASQGGVSLAGCKGPRHFKKSSAPASMRAEWSGPCAAA